MEREMEYSNEELNYFRICYITTNIITEGLRSVFKQEWNNTRFKASLGDWQDTAKNGVDFDNQETPASKKKNKRLLTTMKNGNTKEWDCTALFFGILYSNTIGASLNTAIFNHVDALRVFRNEVFAHVLEGRISNIDFQRLVGVVETAFTGLNLAVDAIRAIAKQKDFPTEEVKNLKKDMQVLQEERDALEEELKATPKSFLGALPIKPSHVIQKREEEVSRIIKQLKDLSENSDGEVRTVYISGNPGCGKSQLAREIGEEVFKQESSANTFFVASINAATQDEMVVSYSGLARQLGCTEYAVSKITTSKEFTVEQKLEQLKSLIAPKTRAYPSWLLIVDGVVDLTDVRKFWPASGSKEYGAGNVIVTTQDQSAIPECSELSHHICLSEGMQVDDAVSLLTRISQMPDEENILSVAEALDRQPLALACAALYLQSVRSSGSPNFNWKNYLEKLNKGKEERMGEVKKRDMGYPISMPVAVKMAVDRAICEEVLFHSFQLLSVCASSPIPLELIFQYVCKRTNDLDNEEIRAKLTNSSLLNFDSNENTLCFHQVLHRVIKADESLYLSTKEAFEVIATAFEPIKSMADKESTRTKVVFMEHVSCFLHYVNMLHSTHANFYGELSKFTELNIFFEWFTNCATTCLEYGKMTVVKQCLENVLSFIQENGCMEENSSVDDSLSALLLFFCGCVLFELSDYSRALEYFNMSLNLRRKIHGGKIHGDVACCLVNLGNTHYRLSHYTEAIKCHEEALTICRELYGGKHERVAHCLLSLGVVNRSLSQYKKAERFYEQALHIFREVHGEKHGAVADCLLNLGSVHGDLSQNELATRVYEQARGIYRDVYGETHSRVAACLHGLGLVHLHCGRFDEAKELFEQCLPIFSSFGDQRRVGACLHHLGCVSEGLDDMETAAEFFTRALETRRLFLPENHPDVKKSVEGLHRVTRNMAAAKSTDDNKPQTTEQKRKTVETGKGN